MNRHHEKGNVLFLILIAVALFAALSYAVTSSSRSGGGDANSERGLIDSAQVTQYPASVRTAIVRMVINGVTVDQLLFDRPSNFTTGGVDTTAEEGKAVFHPSGGGATFVLAPAEVMDSATQGEWYFSSEYQITDIGTDSASANSANDVIAFLPGIKETVCEKLNTQLAITGGTDADSNGVSAGPTAAPATQDLAAPGIGAVANAAHTIAGAFIGQPFGCYDKADGSAGTASGDFVYYHVLVER